MASRKMNHILYARSHTIVVIKELHAICIRHTVQSATNPHIPADEHGILVLLLLKVLFSGRIFIKLHIYYLHIVRI